MKIGRRASRAGSVEVVDKIPKICSCRGEAFGQKILGDRHRVLSECFALTGERYSNRQGGWDVH
jgi:hypothetical protein